MDAAGEYLRRDRRLVDAARRLHGSETVDLDNDARVLRLDEPGPDQGGAWVAAWVYLTPEQVAEAQAHQEARP